MVASIGVLDALIVALSSWTNREEEKDEACETTTVAWLAGATALAARERRNQGCFLKLWALPRCCSRMFQFFTGLCGFRFAEERGTFADMWTSLDTFSWKAACAQKCLRQQCWEYFYTSLWRARTVGPVFPAVLFPVAFLDFLCTDRQVSSRKRDRACWSSELYLGFVSTKEKLVCSYKTIHGEKVKSDQKTLCTCHRISGYAPLPIRSPHTKWLGQKLFA